MVRNHATLNIWTYSSHRQKASPKNHHHYEQNSGDVLTRWASNTSFHYQWFTCGNRSVIHFFVAVIRTTAFHLKRHWINFNAYLLKKERCASKNRLVFIIDNFSGKSINVPMAHLLRKVIYIPIYLSIWKHQCYYLYSHYCCYYY